MSSNPSEARSASPKGVKPTSWSGRESKSSRVCTAITPVVAALPSTAKTGNCALFSVHSSSHPFGTLVASTLIFAIDPGATPSGSLINNCVASGLATRSKAIDAPLIPLIETTRHPVGSAIRNVNSFSWLGTSAIVPATRCSCSPSVSSMVARTSNCAGGRVKRADSLKSSCGA